MTRHRKNLRKQKLMGLALIMIGVIGILLDPAFVIIFACFIPLGVWMLFAKENVLDDKNKKKPKTKQKDR